MNISTSEVLPGFVAWYRRYGFRAKAVKDPFEDWMVLPFSIL
jgi:hypothetical protein